MKIRKVIQNWPKPIVAAYESETTNMIKTFKGVFFKVDISKKNEGGFHDALTQGQSKRLIY